VNKTSIEWTHRPGTVGMTWNPIHFRRTDGSTIQRTSSKGRVYPVTGNMCTRISPGCTHCYASTLNERQGNQLAYTVENLSKGEFYLDEKELQAPLRTKKPCTIFVGDMFDLFHEAIPDGMIQRVIGTAICAEQHTFQFLTKRAERMQAHIGGDFGVNAYGPPKNCWLGVSVESQKYADERIPLLLQTPAAVRFLSVEPQLEAVDLAKVSLLRSSGYLRVRTNCLTGEIFDTDEQPTAEGFGIDWVICGGESGPGARPFNLSWAESLREQCKAAGVAFFMKQIGSKPFWPCNKTEDGIGGTIYPPTKKDRKGGDPQEWPESLRVREFPR
jgi:protein gp37